MTGLLIALAAALLTVATAGVVLSLLAGPWWAALIWALLVLFGAVLLVASYRGRRLT